MQENLTVTIDAQGQVFYGGIQVGEGPEAFDAALSRVPLTEIGVIRVRDERVLDQNKVEGEYPKAQEWEFPGDAYATVQEGIKETPPSLYPLTPTKPRELRDRERVYLEPAVQSTVHPVAQTDWDALREDIRRERAEKAGVKDTRDLFENSKPIQPLSDEPFRIRSLAEREAERIAAEEKAREEEEQVDEDGEAIPDLLEHHEEGVDVEWHSSESVRDDPKDYLNETVQFLTKADQEEAPEYPEGTNSSTSYLLGERLSTEPIAMQKARLDVKKVRNRTPLYVMGALAVAASIFFGINHFVNPPIPYNEVCIDSRTQLVTEQARCEDGDKDATVAYVPQEQALTLENMDSLPEGSKLTEPTGRVAINKLGEE